MKYTFIKSCYCATVLALLSACGGSSGGGSSTPEPETLSGVFIDSPVQGLSWISGELSGTTDTDGTFQYVDGDSVQFLIGDILLGETLGDAVITPLDLVDGAQDINNSTVLNIVKFLMTIDNNSDPSNGITITNTVADLASGETVDFSLSSSDFENSSEIQILISSLSSATDAGARTIVSTSEAQLHIGDSVKDLLTGTYSGTYAGDVSGTWTGTLSTSGTLTGTATDSSGETANLSGTVSVDGSGATEFESSGGATDGTIFSGTFDTNGTASGTWNWFDEESGTWTGSKVE